MRVRPPRFLIALAVLVAAGSFAISGHFPWTRLSDVPVADAIVVSNPFHLVRDTLRSGETLSALFARQGVLGIDLTTLAQALSFDPRRIQPGKVFTVHRDAVTDEPTEIEFRQSTDQRLRFIRTSGGGWEGMAIPIHWSVDTIRLGTTVDSNSSLFQAMADEMRNSPVDAQESAALVESLAEINAWTVDFSREIQPGDRFAWVVERKTSEDGEVRFGRTLATEIILSGKAIRSFDFATPSGADAYYDEKGNSLKKAFLMAPVQFKYITSGFSRARFHPILGITRKHEGIDYAANKGTPVEAAGDGVVTHAGWSGGYGNLIEIRHQNGISTRYGHLSRIEVHSGEHVEQGEEIGKVGMTGLATGPHLHYEFRVNGVARDPRSVKVAEGPPLPASAMAEFQRNRDLLLDLLGRRPAAAAVIAE